MNLRFRQLPDLSAGAVLFQPGPLDASVQHLLTDSRQPIPDPAGSVFFALRGPNHDGHRYLADLYARGVRLFVVAADAALPPLPDAGVVTAPDTLRMLQAVAAWHRRQFPSLPVLGITGSNGKTIVKEWITQLLGPDERIVRSPRSWNSQLGVPLSVWGISEQHTLGIFEAGISQPNEMDQLEAVIQPTIGLITMLGPAHAEGFASEEAKLYEKLRLFPHVERLHYCADHALIHQAVQQAGLPGFSWAFHNPAADVRISRVPITNSLAPTRRPKNGPVVQVAFRNEIIELTLPFDDAASVENALHGVAFLLGHGIPLTDIQRRLDRLAPVAMRLERREGLNSCYLLDDSYSNDLASLQIALGFLRQQPRPGGRTLILSDVPQAAMSAPELYRRVAALVRAYGIQCFIGIGPELGRHQESFARAAPLRFFFESTDAFLKALQTSTFRDETILVKGARAFGFERIVAALSPRVHGTVLDVNLDALVHNLNFFRAQLQPATKIMVMVKAFAYGSGSYEVASLLEFHRADYLAVAYADEGAHLREHGIRLPILVLNPSPDALALCWQHQLEPEVYSVEMLRELLTIWPADQPATIHLKLDTGMRRLGFAEEDLPELLDLLRRHTSVDDLSISPLQGRGPDDQLSAAAEVPSPSPSLQGRGPDDQRLSAAAEVPSRSLQGRKPGGGVVRIASIFSHLAAADEARHDAFTREQLATFYRLSEPIAKVLGYRPLRHILNSAGIVRFPDAQMEMVRLGIGLYGVDATDTLAPDALRPVSSLRTTISQIKTLPPGATVGYGRRGAATDYPRRIATLAIGYADGYDRRFSNGVGEVVIRGQRAPIVGTVCMDMCMADVTHIPDARAGDRALVFGPDLPLSDLAKRIGTIAYELLTNVSERVRRVFFSE